VFDVNLRPPHYSPAIIKILLRLADIAKMNHQELEELLGWFGFEGTEEEQMAFLRQEFNLKLLLVTRDENGAAVLTNNGYFEHPGFTVVVEDTIGSGDAFLATFLKGYLEGAAVPEILHRACLIGAYVATQKGATATYDPEQVEALIVGDTASKQHEKIIVK
jgi:fructokinase